MSAYKGYESYKENVLPKIKSELDGIEKGQSPKTLFITCSDSRIMPNQLTNTKHGELFVIRNAGNSIPSEKENAAASYSNADVATLEYAVEVLKVEEVIVCGHSHCGAIGAVKAGGTPTLKNLDHYLKNFEALKFAVAEDASLDDLIVENVKLQIGNIKSHNFVQQAIDQGRLEVKGWVYRLNEGDVNIIA